MKLLFLLALLLIVACAPLPIEEVPEEVNETVEEQEIVPKEVPVEEELPKIDITGGNITLNKNEAITAVIKSKEYRIEVIDVTEQADACLIKIDDVLTLIEEGDTRTVNGLRIYVAEVRAFRSFTEDRDICKLVIA